MEIRKAGGHRIAIVSWDDLRRFLGQIVAMLEESAFVPEVIIGVLRGGCVPAIWLSHLLRVSEVQAITVRSTVSDAVRAARRRAYVEAAPRRELLAGKKILLVDDVANTGATLKAATEWILAAGCTELRSAVPIRDTITAHTYALPDFWATEVDGWVVFPWEECPTLDLETSGAT